MERKTVTLAAAAVVACLGLYALWRRGSGPGTKETKNKQAPAPSAASQPSCEDAKLDQEIGFTRSEMHTQQLVGTVNPYTRHVFVITNEQADTWPSKWEESEGLPSLLAEKLKERKKEAGKVKLTAAVATGEDQAGDVLMFPEGLRIRGLAPSTIDSFITEYMAGGRKDSVGPFTTQPLSDPRSVFVCSHTNRDKRCGYMGPKLIDSFRECLEKEGLGSITVRACSHVGGHVYAGNVIVYSTRTPSNTLGGDWYGYVDPSGAQEIVSQHIKNGKVVLRLWRGGMGLSEEQQVDWWKEECAQSGLDCAKCQCVKA
eukprot:comp12094_c0_seq1/m.6826 comp12094_c0_seq1/g.6826  ORF comp12094_c0_seq1/g.6826 comp12094_c0_seq1/m.6826 type:complete len:314 (-) comp12094_c0_seq1:39-980(-)